jgi:hydrogenase 3 maturation protease
VPEDLGKFLAQKHGKILFVGIGNVLKQDDGIGVWISNRIRNTGSVTAITAEVSIENYIGKINSLRPDILVLVDCVDMHSEPGTFRLFKVNKIIDKTFNTHNISLKKITGFFSMPVYILGIQPLKIDFGENISYLVQDAGNRIVELINKQEVKDVS